jgi:hypothetical protein
MNAASASSYETECLFCDAVFPNHDPKLLENHLEKEHCIDLKKTAPDTMFRLKRNVRKTSNSICRRNARERRRVDAIRKVYKRLRAVLPEQEKKLSEAGLLRLASSRIRELQEILEQPVDTPHHVFDNISSSPAVALDDFDNVSFSSISQLLPAGSELQEILEQPVDTHHNVFDNISSSPAVALDDFDNVSFSLISQLLPAGRELQEILEQPVDTHHNVFDHISSSPAVALDDFDNISLSLISQLLPAGRELQEILEHPVDTHHNVFDNISSSPDVALDDLDNTSFSSISQLLPAVPLEDLTSLYF